MTWTEACRYLQRSAAHPHLRSQPGPALPGLAAWWRLFLPVSYTFWWPGGLALLVSGGVLETSGNLQVDSRDLLYSRQQHVNASELQLQLCCWADDVIMHQNRPGWILPASQEHPVCPDLMLPGLQRGQVPEGGCRMRRGHLAPRPPQERLRDLPRHGWERLRLPVPLQAHPGEEIPVPLMQGKTFREAQ